MNYTAATFALVLLAGGVVYIDHTSGTKEPSSSGPASYTSGPWYTLRPLTFATATGDTVTAPAGSEVEKLDAYTIRYQGKEHRIQSGDISNDPVYVGKAVYGEAAPRVTSASIESRRQEVKGSLRLLEEKIATLRQEVMIMNKEIIALAKRNRPNDLARKVSEKELTLAQLEAERKALLMRSAGK